VAGPRSEMQLKREQRYHGDYVYVPIHLTAKTFHNVYQEDVNQVIAKERQSATMNNIEWVDKPIPGIAPIRELLDGVHPQLFDLATHIFTEDTKKNRELDRSASYNNDPNWFEEWYKPISPSSTGQGCNKWNCMICGQLIKAHLKSKYKSASLEGQEKEREEQRVYDEFERLLHSPSPPSLL
jgi:hypothetical protein